MSNEKVKKYLEKIKAENKLDTEYIDCLIKGVEENHEGPVIAQSILEVIDKRYAQNKKDNP